jgi:hypothetical protein
VLVPWTTAGECQKPTLINHSRLQRNMSSRYDVWFERSYPGRETQHLRIEVRIASGFTVAVIDCTPTDLHDGKALGAALNEYNVTGIDEKRTSGNVALIKSAEDETDTTEGKGRYALPAS